MHSFILPLLSILTTTSLSAPTPFAPFTIPSLLITTSPASYELTFSIHDPKPTADVLATCTATWDALTNNYPTKYTSCIDALGFEGKGAEFSWFLDYFNNIGDFGLKIRHSYMDESVGPCTVNEDGTPVYCGMSTFGERNVSAATGDLSCEGTSCSNSSEGETKVIDVPIVAAIA